MKQPIHIGTSGWFYPHWDQVFYPKEVKANERLPYYAQFFQTVEINNTFYRIPKKEMIEGWRKKVPNEFLFSVKASQFITHFKRLQNCEDTVKFFLEQAAFLKKKLGPILFQLPPSFKKNVEILENFLKLLPKKKEFTFEFRHSSWFDVEVYEILKKHQIALCITDLKGKLSPIELTAPFTYIRLHGPQNAYSGSYGTDKLKTWKKRILEFENKKVKTYCYFDNDEKGYAVKDALELKKLIGL